MTEDFKEIRRFSGCFSGVGTNHENESFIGRLELAELLGGKGFQIRFTAHAQDRPSLLFHSEVSTLAPNKAGGLSLFNLNTNTPFLAEHVLVSSETSETSRQLTFRFGETDNQDSFREEVRMELMSDGRIGYHYSWGLPGGDFAYRSGVLLEKQTER